MNSKEILKLIEKHSDITQRKLSEKLGYSLGKVNLLIKELEEKGYLIKNNGYFLTDLGVEKLKELEEKKIKLGVILGAGISKDFHMPNGFIEFDGEALIEKSIKKLLEIGIKKIYIVVGFKKEYYEKLKKKYKEVELFGNEEYEKKSSYFSLKKLENIIDEDFILLDSDILYEKKALEKIIDLSEENIILMSSETGSKDECFVEIDEKNNILKMSKDRNELKKIDGEMLGISKISLEFFRKMMNLNVANPFYSYEYAIGDIGRGENLIGLKLNELIWGEIDNKEQYNKILKEIYPKLKRNESLNKIKEIKELVVSILDIDCIDIDKIEVLGGMTNKNYLVIINNKKYVLRVPGQGTKEMINRYSEKINAKEAAKLGVDKELTYFNSETGIKISEYIEGAETLNPETSKKIENIKLTTSLLRKLHNSNIKLENKFDVYKEIVKYEDLINDKELLYKKYKNYKENRENIFKLEKILKENGLEIKSCHNDTVPENFIKNNKNEIYLIDWEYSGMNDPMWDLAAHSIESNFSESDERTFFEEYFQGKIKKENLLRIEIYKTLQDFLWSIWTVLKEEKGDDFGNYGIERYLRSEKRLREIMKNEISNNNRC